MLPIIPLLFWYLGSLRNWRPTINLNKAGYIFPVVLAFVLVVLLFLFHFFVVTPFLGEISEPSDLDESSLETEIFKTVNRKRLELGNKPLEWDERIHRAAKAHSLDLAERKDFSHYNVEGASVTDRLRNEDLFFFMAAENLSMLSKGIKNIPDAVVQGWMKSPGHRATIVDRDHRHTHGAVGVSCDQASCYVTFNCADFVASKNVTLKPGYYIYINLNDASLGLQASYPVHVEVRSSSSVDIYFFDSFTKVNAFVETGADSSAYSVTDIKNFRDQRMAERDAYILIKNNSDSTGDVRCELIYN